MRARSRCSQSTLEGLGFACETVEFAEPGTAPVLNLYARLRHGRAQFLLRRPHRRGAAGRPRGLVASIRSPARCGRHALWPRRRRHEGRDRLLRRRRARQFLDERGPEFDGSISFLITGDEEAAAINGTRKLLDWLAARGERLDACVVGEPTSAERARRHGQDRPARQPQRLSHRARRRRATPPIRISPTTRRIGSSPCCTR